METNGLQFVDIFAGAGGLSLGLMKAGWTGLFAVEKSPMAFQTLKYNLVDQQNTPRFAWPDWLPIEPIDIQTLLSTYQTQLKKLRGVSLLVGGPPCQGFSHSGRRKYDDERNRLFEQYLELVKLIEPQMLLVENVQGFAKSFTKTERGANGEQLQEKIFNADQALRDQLTQIGYICFRQRSLKAKEFGVPQLRPRYILIAVRQDLLKQAPFLDPIEILYASRERFLSMRGLPTSRDVTLHEAISDLEKRHGYRECIEPRMSRFYQGIYGAVNPDNQYQQLMRQHRDGTLIEQGEVADSHRFPNHRPRIEARFRRIIDEFRPGIQLKEAEREKLAVNKHRIAPLACDEACHTLTSLPDDLVHYEEPRIPTVREYARIQSFPDWFEFKSKYTTGDKNRKIEVPRYTQVANAVPPLLAEAIGLALKIFLASVQDQMLPIASHPSTIEEAMVPLISALQEQTEKYELTRTFVPE